MPQFPLRPGDLPVGAPVYVVVFGLVKHWGILADRFVDGKPTVVSNSYRAGGTFEEAWDAFSGGRDVHYAPLSTALAGSEVLRRARARLGRRWSLWSWNCEHAVREALGLPVQSPQLRTAVAVGVIAWIARSDPGSA
jgi:hypothetical protein